MARNCHTVEQIVNKLREAEVELSEKETTAEICKKLGISEQTF